MSCTTWKWMPGDAAKCIAALGGQYTLPKGIAACSKALGRIITRASLDSYFRKTGLQTARSYLRKIDDAPPPTVASDDIPVDVDTSELHPATFDEEEPTQPGTRTIPPARESAREIDPVEARDVRDETARLRRQVDQLVDQLREARARQAVLDAMPQSHEPPRIVARERSGVREMTPVVLASDWHVEETVEPESVAGRNEYNLEIADARIKRFFASVVWNVEHHRASGRITIRDLLLWLGGDLITGYIHEELIEANALSPTETMLWLMPRLRDGIASLLTHLDLEHIEIPCSYGNHGRTTPRTRVSTGAANSFEWLLYHQLAASFADEPRVHFQVTASAHQYVDVYGYRLHFHHGDSVRYAGGVGGLGVPLLKAIAPWDLLMKSDLHHVGHFHQFSDFGRVLVNGSLIGYGPYSQHIRAQFEAPQQMLYFLDSKRGKTLVTPLWVGERESAAAA